MKGLKLISNWQLWWHFCDIWHHQVFELQQKTIFRLFSPDVKGAITFVMIRGSRCSAPPLSVKPQGAFPWSSTSTSSSSCQPAVLLHLSTSLHQLILSAGPLRWSLGSTESMTLVVQPLTLVYPESLENRWNCQISTTMFNMKQNNGPKFI